MFSTKEIESGVIFEKCTVQEISNIEKKLRHDIEKKKEDLRQMVGERYRELIEAADTITDMKNGTEKVAASIVNLQEFCQKLKQSSTNFHKVASTNASKSLNTIPRSQTNKFNQAVCTKLLMDIPNRIWSCLDRGEYLRATRIYLLADHIHSCLRSEFGGHATRIINIVVRQWTAINHLRLTIIKGVESKLKDSQLPDEMTAECLSSIILLQDVSVEKVFQKFLKSRSEFMLQHLESCGTDVSVKPLMCDVVLLLLVTLRQVRAVFVKEEEGKEGLLMPMLQSALSTGSSDLLKNDGNLTDTAMKYLPAHVIGFKPTLKVQLGSLDEKFIVAQTSEFLQSSSERIQDGIPSLLRLVGSIKALAGMRDEIYLLIKKNSEMCDWQGLCSQVIGREFDLWSELLRKHFLERLKALLQSRMDELVVSTTTQVSTMLEDLEDANNNTLASERNLSNYIWLENAGDITQNAAWTPLAQKTININREGGLHMKAKGYTPAVQSFCLNIDRKMSTLFTEVATYINPPVFQSNNIPVKLPETRSTTLTSAVTGFLSSVFSSSQSSISLEDCFADRLPVQEMLQNACASCLDCLLKFLQEKLVGCQAEIANDKNSLITLQRTLYIGRISIGLCELSPSLQSCMSDGMLEDSVNKPPRSNKLPATNPRNSAAKIPDNKNWLDLVMKLDSFGRDVYLIWCDHVVSKLSKEFEAALKLRRENSYAAFVTSCTQWDSIAIEEENEEGRAVKSTIKVPMQVSWYVQELLYNLCARINEVGGHVIHGSTINCLTKNLMDEILSFYRDLLSSSSSLHQSRALQLWFDIKYLLGMLSSTSDEESEAKMTSEEVLEMLESHVDPFDLDVFRPHLKKHLSRQMQRTSILYGMILSPEKSAFSTPPTSSSGQEHHHVVPISTGPSRFPLLPLPQQTGKLITDGGPSSKLVQKSLEAVNLDTHKTFAPIVPSPAPVQRELPPPRAGSSSFLEQMSTLFGSSSSATLYIK